MKNFLIQQQTEEKNPKINEHIIDKKPLNLVKNWGWKLITNKVVAGNVKDVNKKYLNLNGR